MKRTIVSLITILAVSLCAQAQQRAVERMYLSTDRGAYVAGDCIWISAFCIDAADNCTPSKVSRTAYVELHADGAAVQTAKMALDAGRGACRLEIPKSVPTGNYTVIAYTVQNLNEENYDFLSSSKVVSVFNTFTTQRVENGVEVVDDKEYADASPLTAQQSGDITVTSSQDGGKATVTVANMGELADVSISVCVDDMIQNPANEGMGDFIKRASKDSGKKITDRYTPEYEGEIVTARVVCPDTTLLKEIKGRSAFISTPGDLDGMHLTLIEDPENIEFYTGNIYGMRDMVLELSGTKPEERCHLELKDKFVDPVVKQAPSLKISKAIESSLQSRSVAMQNARRVESDSLYEHLPYRSSKVFERQSVVRYVLDDYTRFPVMNELFIEFIKEVYSEVKRDGTVNILLHLSDSFNPAFNKLPNSLMLVDGTPVPDQSKVYEYDPLLVQYVDVYPNTYISGNRLIAGAVNFITYKRNMPAMVFNDNVRIVDFKGTDYPMAITDGDRPEGEDFRQTLYWHPMTRIEAGGQTSFKISLPSDGRKFKIVVEGITASGEPVYRTAPL